MAELISIKDMPSNMKVELLRELGYNSDGEWVLETNGQKHLERYTKEPIRITNMVIFPGSVIVLDNNPLSITSFIEEFGDVF